jgi:GT2 family glycosyltransferase
MLRRVLRSQLWTREGRRARKVIAQKRARAAAPEVYTEWPAVSLIVQSFNHRGNVERIVDSLRRTAAEELIVCEDGSLDGSDLAWRQHLQRPNDFLILSNDLHEIRTYNRAASLSRGEIIGFLQDDDIPPRSPDWLSDAISLFRRHPGLAVLGCWNGCVLDLGDFDRSVGYGPNYFERSGEPISHLDPETGIPFMYVDVVGIGPIFCRRTDFEALGGFESRLSEPGEPGIWLDYDLCLRAWTSGRHVGLYETAPFDRNVGGQGTVLYSGAKRFENWSKNGRHVERSFGAQMSSIHRTLAELNSSLSRRLEPTREKRSPAG